MGHGRRETGVLALACGDLSRPRRLGGLGFPETACSVAGLVFPLLLLLRAVTAAANFLSRWPEANGARRGLIMHRPKIMATFLVSSNLERENFAEISPGSGFHY